MWIQFVIALAAIIGISGFLGSGHCPKTEKPKVQFEDSPCEGDGGLELSEDYDADKDLFVKLPGGKNEKAPSCPSNVVGGAREIRRGSSAKDRDSGAGTD